MHHLLVEEAGAARRGRQHPQYEQDLDLVVEREPGEEDVGERLQRGEQREHDPVHHPLDVLAHVLVLDGLVAAVGRVQRAQNQT